MLSRLLGRKKAEVALAPPPCPHKALVPRWQNAEEMGKKDLVSSYICTACGSEFSRDEGVTLLGG